MLVGKLGNVLECKIEDCHKRVKCRGWCSMHYERWRRLGSPYANTEPRKPYGQGGPFIHVSGYVEYYRPNHPLARGDGRVFEHRYVAWEAGILTDQSMEVHHINGNKTDNRLENLEVISKADHARLHAKENGVSNQYGLWFIKDS